MYIKTSWKRMKSGYISEWCAMLLVERWMNSSTVWRKHWAASVDRKLVIGSTQPNRSTSAQQRNNSDAQIHVCIVTAGWSLPVNWLLYDCNFNTQNKNCLLATSWIYSPHLTVKLSYRRTTAWRSLSVKNPVKLILQGVPKKRTPP